MVNEPSVFEPFKFYCTFLKLQLGQEIEIKPGKVSKDQNGTLTCQPIKSKIVSLYSEQNELQYAVPGGLIGMYNLREKF